jgi:hypothetical protein
MGTENWVTAEVTAPAGVPFPSDIRLAAFYNAHAGDKGRVILNPWDNPSADYALPGWSNDDGEEEREETRRRWMQFWTGGYDFDVLCNGAEILSARFPGVTVTVSIDNADEPGRSEEVYRNGKRILSGGETAPRTLLSTRQIIDLAISRMPADYSAEWADELARQIDAGEVTS